MTPVDRLAAELAVTDLGGEPTTAAEVVALLTAQKPSPHRAAWFAAMREALAYLEAHPDLPIPPPYTQTAISHFLPHDAFDRVEQIAGRLGVTAEVRDGGGHCIAARDFGAGVVYEVMSHTQERLDRHAAEITYAGQVSP